MEGKRENGGNPEPAHKSHTHQIKSVKHFVMLWACHRTQVGPAVSPRDDEEAQGVRACC